MADDYTKFYAMSLEVIHRLSTDFGKLSTKTIKTLTTQKRGEQHRPRSRQY